MNEKLKLLFFITGENDHMMDDSMRNFVKTCDDFGVNHVFYEVRDVDMMILLGPLSVRIYEIRI